MSLEDIMPSELSQTQKDKHTMITFRKLRQENEGNLQLPPSRWQQGPNAIRVWELLALQLNLWWDPAPVTPDCSL
jgi:hypothetical protein